MISGLNQLASQPLVLAKLSAVRLFNDLNPMLRPHVIIKATHLPAKRPLLARIVGRLNFLRGLTIIKQKCL